jgi:hypothetical protein
MLTRNLRMYCMCMYLLVNFALIKVIHNLWVWVSVQTDRETLYINGALRCSALLYLSMCIVSLHQTLLSLAGHIWMHAHARMVLF